MFVRTRNLGFLWLGIAIVLWPYVCNFLGHLIGHAIVTRYQITIGMFFICLEAVKDIVTVLFLFIAIFYFGRRTLPNVVRTF
jgi:hypothetical protein